MAGFASALLGVADRLPRGDAADRPRRNAGGGGAPVAAVKVRALRRPIPPPAPKLRTSPVGRPTTTRRWSPAAPPAPRAVRDLRRRRAAAGAPAQGPGCAASLGRPAGPGRRQRDRRLLRRSRSRSAVGDSSACSDPVVYVEDSTAPRTRITMGPGVKTAQAQGGLPLHRHHRRRRPAPPSSARSTARKWKRVQLAAAPAPPAAATRTRCGSRRSTPPATRERKAGASGASR